MPLKETTLNDDDWQALAGFAFAHRPLLTSLGCLSRLLQRSELPLPALRGRVDERCGDTELCQRLKVSGRKALLLVQRAEAAQALAQIDAARTQQLQNRIMQWQFFTDFFNFTAWSLRLSGVELLLSVKDRHET